MKPFSCSLGKEKGPGWYVSEEASSGEGREGRARRVWARISEKTMVRGTL